MNVAVVEASVAELIREVIRDLRDFAVASRRTNGNEMAVHLQRGPLIVGGVVSALGLRVNGWATKYQDRGGKSGPDHSDSLVMNRIRLVNIHHK